MSSDVENKKRQEMLARGISGGLTKRITGVVYATRPEQISQEVLLSGAIKLGVDLSVPGNEEKLRNFLFKNQIVDLSSSFWEAFGHEINLNASISDKVVKKK